MFEERRGKDWADKEQVYKKMKLPLLKEIRSEAPTSAADLRRESNKNRKDAPGEEDLYNAAATE